MAAFLTDLFQSIFTPGPTPTLLVATNVAFAALQVVLLALLIATYSIHFIILSFLCGGLWWAINWFAHEISIATEREEQANKLRETEPVRDIKLTEDSGTETEDAGHLAKQAEPLGSSKAGLRPVSTDESLRKRRSLGEVSGTDSEWDKVENEDDEN